MEFRRLGRSGLQVSALTYGNWVTHGGQIDDDTATGCVQAALDAGITTFDTADVYAGGRAEQVLGRALAGVRRESVVLLTKVYWPTGSRGHNDTGLSRKHIRESIDASLRRLGTDYVDVYQAHRYDVMTPLEETISAFAQVVSSGKARYIGVSEWSVEQLWAGQELAAANGFRIVSNQPEYSLLWRAVEAEVLLASAELGIGQIAFSPLAQGVLTGKYLPARPVPSDSRAATAGEIHNPVTRFLSTDILTAVARLRPIAAELGLTMAQLALAWVLRGDVVATVVIGASRPQQLTENVKAVGVRLTDEVLGRLDDALGEVVERDPARIPERTPTARVC